MDETLGTRLKRLRTMHGLTQREVAGRIYVSERTIGLYETDCRQPTSERLKQFSDLFHVSTDYLLGLRGEQNIDASGLTEKERVLISELVADLAQKNK